MTKLTIQQIADIAGVNKATVSRVLNGNMNVSQKTQEKVEKVIREHNYVPNTIARGLAFNKTFTMGFCHDYTDKRAFANPFFYKMLQGIENVVYRNDYLFLMMSHPTGQQKKSMFERMVSEQRVDGIILPSTLLNDSSFQLLTANRMPFVVLGEKEFAHRNVHWVDVDNVQAAESLTERLIGLGHRRIWIFADRASIERDKFIQDRIAGYSNVMAGHGLPSFVVSRLESLLTKESGINDNSLLPDAVICCTHDQLFSILDEEKKEGSPAEFELATFDDNPLFQYLSKTVHYISIDLEQMGEQAATLLFKKINQEEDIPDMIRIPTS
ncbi:LacI family DNA-binding transcriptional regulator [Cohnella faecalis]|uniref:LacI family transcriptional regulator n=1 Tax=Cohnella faecalis TaxID=2315694 RepID=A0A398CQC1_9BACL|nr:LacI family DNA-binding transcriptional regulator [Cohnella faecalis]RIE01621.1 LacI family transcriptional regulator [Cohnella faecalis]